MNNDFSKSAWITCRICYVSGALEGMVLDARVSRANAVVGRRVRSSASTNAFVVIAIR